jgi:hypothetical protein
VLELLIALDDDPDARLSEDELRDQALSLVVSWVRHDDRGDRLDEPPAGPRRTAGNRSARSWRV